MGPKQKRRQRNEDGSDSDGGATAPTNAAKFDPLKDDALVFRNTGVARPFTTSRLFKEKLCDGIGKVMVPDWSRLKSALAARDASSPAWFLHVGDEEVGVDDGSLNSDPVKVQWAVVCEAGGPTIAPRTFTIREHRVYADDEDYMPEKVKNFADHGFGWLEVLGDDVPGEAPKHINTYMLVTAAERESLTAKQMDFGFGAPAPTAAPTTTTTTTTTTTDAPATTTTTTDDSPPQRNTSSATSFGGGFGGGTGSFSSGFGNAASSAPPAPASGNASFSAGFGSQPAAAATTAPNTSFSAGFGNNASQPQPQQQQSFSAGFGNSQPQPAAPPNTLAMDASQGGSGSGGFTAGFGAAPATSTASADVSARPTVASAPAPAAAAAPAGVVSGIPKHSADLHFRIWAPDTLREMKQIVRQGSRIVRRDVQLKSEDGAPFTFPKLTMQNDLQDKPAAVVKQQIEKRFSQTNVRCKKFATWCESCPEVEPHITEPLDEMRKRIIKDASKSDGATEFDALKQHEAALVAELKSIVDQRKAEVKQELAVLDEAEKAIKAKTALPRAHWRVLKFHAANDVVKFCPHGKARELTAPGKSVDECVPPPYVKQRTSSFFKTD